MLGPFWVYLSFGIVYKKNIFKVIFDSTQNKHSR